MIHSVRCLKDVPEISQSLPIKRKRRSLVQGTVYIYTIRWKFKLKSSLCFERSIDISKVAWKYHLKSVMNVLKIFELNWLSGCLVSRMLWMSKRCVLRKSSVELNTWLKFKSRAKRISGLNWSRADVGFKVDFCIIIIQ